MKLLSVSLVLYKSDAEDLELLLKSFEKVVVEYDLYVIDQSPTDELKPLFINRRANIHYEYTGNNLGYGGGHNYGIKKAAGKNYKYHLVTNPDVYFNKGTISSMIDHLEENPKVGLTCPKIYWPDGMIQPTCRRDPKPFDLFARRFLPAKWVNDRLALYSMQDKSYEEKINVEFSPGSFMFFRSAALSKVEGFDEIYFMYMEDADITRRTRRAGYEVRLTPEASIFIYFNKFGWRPFF